MSLPKIPEIPHSLTRDQAINMILASVAMGEVALSKIINAEHEKIKYMVEYAENNDSDQARQALLEANQSVAIVLKYVYEIEEILKEKTKLVIEQPISPKPPPCPPSPPKPPPPKPPCPFCPPCLSKPCAFCSPCLPKPKPPFGADKYDWPDF